MRNWSIVGVLLVLMGIGVLVVGRFSYTTEKPVVAIGPLTASVAEQHSFAFPDYAGAGFIVAGLALVLLTRRQS